MSNVPHRNNQNAINRFAKVIQWINDNYPKAILVENDKYSTVSDFRIFLRHAITGIHKYGLNHPTIPREAILKWSGEYTTRIYDGNVVIGGKEEVKAYGYKPTKTYGRELDVEVNLAREIDDAVNEQVVHALLTLADNAYLDDLKFPLSIEEKVKALVQEHFVTLETHTSETHIHIF